MSVKALLAIGLLVCAAGSTPVRAQSDKGGSVAGVATIDGQPAVGLPIDLRSDTGHAMRTSVGADGRYRFDGVPPGRYLVAPFQCGLIRTNGAGPNEVIVSITVSPGGHVEMRDLAFTPGAYITGRVVDSEGKPVERECVTAIPVDAKGKPVKVEGGEMGGATGLNGVYRLCGLPGGRYLVRVGCSRPGLITGGKSPQKLLYPGVADMATATPVEVEANGGAEGIDFTLGAPFSMRAIAGRVVDGVTGEGIAGVTMELGASDGRRGGMSMTRGETGPDGAFRIDDLRPGKYTITIWPEGETAARYVARPVEVTVTPAADTNVVLKLERAASISGVVVVENGEDGAALAELHELRVRPAEIPQIAPGQMLRMEFAPIGSGNQFRLGGLPAGTVRLMLAEGNRTFWLRRVQLDEEDATAGIQVAAGQQITGAKLVVTRGTGSIRGRIEVKNGGLPSDVRSVIVGLRPPASWGGESAPISAYMATGDATGAFSVEGLLPGEYDLQSVVFLDEMRRPRAATLVEPQRVTVGDHGSVEVVLVVSVEP